MDPVVHFEMPYEDRERLVKFYETAFGWRMQVLGKEMGHYVLAITTDSDESGPRRPGAINGGFFPRQAGGPRQPSLVIAVDDLAAAMKKVRQAGGEVQGQPMPIPGVGDFVAVADSEGNILGMLQPLPRS